MFWRCTYRVVPISLWHSTTRKIIHDKWPQWRLLVRVFAHHVFPSILWKNDTNFSFFFKVQSPKDSLVWLQTLWKKVSWRPALWASWRRERCQVFAALAKGKVCQRARRTEENGALERERLPCMSLKGNAPASGVHVLDRRLSKTHTIFLSLTHFYCGENTRECVCTWIYVCMCTWAPLCVYARACVWMCVCARVSAHVYLPLCVHACVHVPVCV